MKIPAEHVDALLARWPVARLATLREDGRPRLVPVVFARAGDCLWSPVDAKPKRAGGGELARVRDLLRDPRAALVLDRYDADWTRLWWIRIDTDAKVCRPRDPERDPEVAAALAALRAKYAQYRTTAVLRDPPTILRLPLSRVASWCAGPGALARADDPSGTGPAFW